MSADHELVVERMMDAPVAALWTAYTDHLNEWFCPAPWRAEVQEIDPRAGGKSAITMYGPDGEVMPNEGVYLEVIPERLIVFTDAFTHAGTLRGRSWSDRSSSNRRATRRSIAVAPGTGPLRPRPSTKRWVSPKAGARSPNNGKRSRSVLPGAAKIVRL